MLSSKFVTEDTAFYPIFTAILSTFPSEREGEIILKTHLLCFVDLRMSIILDNDNLIHACVNLQYVYYNPLHVSSIICSSSGG